MLLKEAPTSYYQYERDFKSLKNDMQRKVKYLLNIQPANFKNIFKKDLEADLMLDIFKTFMGQDA